VHAPGAHPEHEGTSRRLSFARFAVVGADDFAGFALSKSFQNLMDTVETVVGHDVLVSHGCSGDVALRSDGMRRMELHAVIARRDTSRRIHS